MGRLASGAGAVLTIGLVLSPARAQDDLTQKQLAMLAAEVQFFAALSLAQKSEAEQKDAAAKTLAEWWAAYVNGLNKPLADR